MTIVLIVAGALAGGVFALTAYDDIVTVAVGQESATISRAGKSAAYQREDITAVFADGKNLVLQGAGGYELAREKNDHAASTMQQAFQAQGYPWVGSDPFGSDFRRWVDDMPGLPEGANALLRARAEALRNGDREDASELYAELVKLGVVVRDEKKKQYWRLAT